MMIFHAPNINMEYITLKIELGSQPEEPWNQPEEAQNQPERPRNKPEEPRDHPEEPRSQPVSREILHTRWIVHASSLLWITRVATIIAWFAIFYWCID